MHIPPEQRHEERSATLRRLATPYSWQETFATMRRNYTGVDRRRNAGIITPAPRHVLLKPDSVPFLTIGLLGDIMNIDRKRLEYGDALLQWAASCDLMVGNFEATISDTRKRAGVAWATNQPQAERIVEDLARFFAPGRFYLNLANNHCAGGRFPPVRHEGQPGGGPARKLADCGRHHVVQPACGRPVVAAQAR
jgi:hypothetical protein